MSEPLMAADEWARLLSEERDRSTALEHQLDGANLKAHDWGVGWNAANKVNIDLRSKNAAMEEALKFYADKNKYNSFDAPMVYVGGQEVPDRGRTAREAQSEGENEK